MNKLKLIIISLTLYTLIGNAQTDLVKSIEYWKNTSDYCEFLYHDLSPAFIYEDASYLGIFGENRYKINIRFDKVSKISDDSYSVIGKSRLKNKIVGFAGEINIERIELCHFDLDRKELWLVLVGTYAFAEDDKKGSFQGSYRKYFIYSRKDNSVITADSHIELSGLEGFAGTWKNIVSGKEIPCHFGFNRYPEEIGGDFDENGGESIINPNYKEKGFESHFIFESGNYGTYGNVDRYDKWWLEK